MICMKKLIDWFRYLFEKRTLNDMLKGVDSYYK